MESGAQEEVRRTLTAAGEGDATASRRLGEILYEELHELAERLMAREPATTLQPTALVHEAWLRLTGGEHGSWNDRGHFFGAAAQAMRRILVERARRRARLKRGAAYGRVELHDFLAAQEPGEPEERELLLIDGALARLEQASKRHADVVMLRYFAGLSIEDTAASLGVSVATVNRDWRFAKAWLYDAVAGELGGG